MSFTALSIASILFIAFMLLFIFFMPNNITFQDSTQSQSSKFNFLSFLKKYSATIYLIISTIFLLVSILLPNKSQMNNLEASNISFISLSIELTILIFLTFLLLFIFSMPNNMTFQDSTQSQSSKFNFLSFLKKYSATIYLITSTIFLLVSILLPNKSQINNLEEIDKAKSSAEVSIVNEKTNPPAYLNK